MMCIYFSVFNFHTSQVIQKYFNNEIFPIYGSYPITALQTLNFVHPILHVGHRYAQYIPIIVFWLG